MAIGYSRSTTQALVDNIVWVIDTNYSSLNPSMSSGISYFLKNNFEMIHKFEKYLKESCKWGSDEQLPFKYFLSIALERYVPLNPSNASATFVKSTRMQRFLKTL